MSSPSAEDRARWRKLAEEQAISSKSGEWNQVVTALLDALEEAERERDQWQRAALSAGRAADGLQDRDALLERTIREALGLLHGFEHTPSRHDPRTVAVLAERAMDVVVAEERLRAALKGDR